MDYLLEWYELRSHEAELRLLFAFTQAPTILQWDSKMYPWWWELETWQTEKAKKALGSEKGCAIAYWTASSVPYTCDRQ
ncbi:uncharacterized protein G2W53_011923 [Senna tora]|uniref:Uncharacterized protein n=1 Tax=Senna tora TaxID=362788 RepID=A0A834TW05_9FABA|nr:uncharacterized protein G2W53_011923 [Senna tora]